MDKYHSGAAYLEQQTREELLLVEAYGDMGFRLKGRRIEGAVLVLEGGFHPVDAGDVSSLTSASFEKLWTEANQPEFLLMGTGEKMCLLPKEVRLYLEEKGMPVEMMDTGAAARTFNVLRMEGRRVATLMMPVP